MYGSFWKAVGEIIAISDGTKSEWSVVYDAWKDVTTALIKGYSGGFFEAWTVPCLYKVGRFLRVFAIRSDDGGKTNRAAKFGAGIQDDIVNDFGKNEKLEDAARVINRMFTLCISDRYVTLTESRPVDDELRLEHSSSGRIEEMGHLLYHQSAVQDILQGIPDPQS